MCKKSFNYWYRVFDLEFHADSDFLRDLTGRPGHCTFPQEMNMEMRYGFSSVGSVVDDDAEPVGKVLFPGDLTAGQQQFSQQSLVFRSGFSEPRNRLLGNDQEVYGRLGLDVVDRDAVVVLVSDRSRYLAIDDAGEKGFLTHG
jgi:hypothetical protein